MDETEQDTVTRARLGQEDALREIIEKHDHLVAATVAGFLGTGPEVDDIGQETFVHFFRALPRFRGESQIGTYITRIAINLSLNELKRRKRYARFAAENIAGTGGAAQNRRDQENTSDIKRMVREGLQRLQPKFKSVVVLRLINGYSTRETARILGLSHGTVLSRLARGQAKLKHIIEDMVDQKPQKRGEKDG
jgi:RNA polymerase sigma-70 factor (ECF subfamily)